MRASSGAILVIVCISACSSSSSSPPGDAGAAGLSDAAIPMPDGHVGFGDGNVAKQLYGVGEQCMHSSDCLSNNCDHDTDGFPGGYCVQDCGPGRYGPQPCPMGTSCTVLNADSPTCYATCTADTDCRTGYGCLDIGASLTQTGGFEDLLAAGAGDQLQRRQRLPALDAALHRRVERRGGRCRRRG